jgi:D-galacturonate reductase
MTNITILETKLTVFQPKSQLETFKAWAGKESDISYYLNSHHIDICESMVRHAGWKPSRVTASGSIGIAESLGCVEGTEDTITLLVTWMRDSDKKVATSVHTASWTAPQRAGVHSNQSFHYMAAGGEVRVDQAKRGYDVADDETGQLVWYNPVSVFVPQSFCVFVFMLTVYLQFYMRYAPDERGNFNGQSGYGYVSFEKFIQAVTEVNEGTATIEELDKREGLPTLANTVLTTAILEAGRRSLDEGGRGVEIHESESKWSFK